MNSKLLTKKAYDALTEAGWYSERKIDFIKQKQKLEEEGWKCFSYVYEIIQNLENINVREGTSLEFCAYDLASGDYEIVEEMKKITGEEVFIIGEYYQKDIYVGESKNIYIGDYPEVYIVTNGIEEALNFLCDKFFVPTLIGVME